VHSSGASFQLNATAADNEQLRANIVLAAGKFACMGIWSYGSGVKGIRLRPESGQWALQTLLSTQINVISIVPYWKQISLVARRLAGGNQSFFIVADNGICYADDLYAFALDDVTLEGAGIRVDGSDTLTQPVTVALKTNKGKIKFNWTPRHNAAEFIKYGLGSDTSIVFRLYTDGNNYILLRTPAANVLRFSCVLAGVASTADYNCTGLIVAGTIYAMEIQYNSTNVILKINNVAVVNLSGITTALTALPATVNFGSGNTFGNDAVFS
jgi:hypothetical protein